MSNDRTTKMPTVTEVCPTCGGNNGVHASDCVARGTSGPGDGGGLRGGVPDDGAGEPTVQLALAVDRINKALQATPLNIALAALATCAGHAQFALQRDPIKRNRNLHTFNHAVRKAVDMAIVAERAAEAQSEAAQQSDPIRKPN